MAHRVNGRIYRFGGKSRALSIDKALWHIGRCPIWTLVCYLYTKYEHLRHLVVWLYTKFPAKHHDFVAVSMDELRNDPPQPTQ